MNLKKTALMLLLLCFLSGCFMLCGFTFFKKDKSTTKNVQNVEVSQGYSQLQNNLWCVTFQLVWNDFMDKFNNGKPVTFEGGNPQIADELNKKLYTTDILSSDSYYKVQDVISYKLKRQIEKEIKKKFNENSDILSMINWNAKDSYLFYVMLKKEFNFLTAFDKLSSDVFNSSNDKVKYFGINKKSDKKLRENVDVLFYQSENEYAVRLLTKENEDVILYRTDKDDTFENLYSYISSNTVFDSFEKGDTLKIPDINVDETISYNELCGKKLENSNYVISQALQTIKFKMDNKGGTLKSEAAIAVMKTSLMPPEYKKPRHFNFDKKFVLFLKETDKSKPYYAMKIDNTNYLVKE